MRGATVFVAGLLFAASASAQMRITEWMYQGGGGEFVEFTNIGGSPIDLTGWSYDDDSRVPGSENLSAFGIVQPGESVVIAEASEADFRTAWGLALTVKIIGGYTNNLGRNDEINLFDSADNLIDRLTYGDQNFPGSIRTQNISGNPMTLAALGANDPLQWQLAAVGDEYGSYISPFGDLGNPGSFVPEPATLSLLVLGGLMLIRRR